MSGVLRGRSSVRISLVAVVMAALTFGFAPFGSAATKVDPIRILNSLPVSSEATSGYSRALFSHWSDLDADGCDTREEVLIQERVSGQVSGCKVVNGKWVSQFDGVSTTNSSNFDIDHFVPLKEAWDSGAWRWDRGTRQRYANDLGYALSLIAVSASSNRSKGARDPAQWLPNQNRCRYAKSWKWNPRPVASTLPPTFAGSPPRPTAPIRQHWPLARPVRVMVIDDHELVREGLVSLMIHGFA